MPDLPSGTVTFLFTDIAGSTALWERDRAAMREAVDRQLAILQSLITAHHEVLYKTVGDGTQAAFGTAEDALRAALASQRALLTEGWVDAPGPLRVRMALHAGEAIPDARGDYLAAPLNRLSRLLSAGHGGQILLSQTVQQLTRGVLPAGSELRDLGEHRLRDLLEPERVFQLLHPDLPDQFPPLESLENRPNNLPLQPTPFLGREHEVQQVVELLRRPEVRFLTLTGPGGTGKTRLALQAAAELLDDFADGVYFVPLAPLTDPDLVPSAMATALGVHQEGGQPLAERLRDYLATKQLLLLLDNVEHLVAAAPAVGELLSISPGLKVLATSRMPLRLRAEREYAVPPLGLPRRKPPPPPEQLSQFEAVRLFIERAQAVKADFSIANETAPAVAEICWRLDGLPLAIELAAARVRMLPPQAMLARLEQRLPMLTSGARDAPERQRTLRNTIAWSYDLLEPEEQDLFRHLAVFARGMTLEAAESVANPDGQLDIFGSLERLVEHNLLRQEEELEGEPRFMMLETIREFGLERLEASGEVHAVRQRHAAFFQILAETAREALDGPEQGTWLERLEAEHDNLRAALAWALPLAPEDGALLAANLTGFWAARGLLSEGREWLDRVLAQRTVLSAAVLGRVVLAAGMMAGLQGDAERSQMLTEESLALGRELGDDQAIAHALNNLGASVMDAGDFASAAAWYGEALTLFQRLGDVPGAAQVTFNLGNIDAFRGKLEQALARYAEALAVYRQLGDRLSEAHVLHNMGMTEVTQNGNPVRGAALLTEALRIYAAFGFPLEQGDCLFGMSGAFALLGQPHAAARMGGAAEAQRECLDVPLYSLFVPYHLRFVETIQEHLGQEAAESDWTAGRALTLEEAVAEALARADEIKMSVQAGSEA